MTGAVGYDEVYAADAIAGVYFEGYATAEIREDIVVVQLTDPFNTASRQRLHLSKAAAVRLVLDITAALHTATQQPDVSAD